MMLRDANDQDFKLVCKTGFPLKKYQNQNKHCLAADHASVFFQAHLACQNLFVEFLLTSNFYKNHLPETWLNLKFNIETEQIESYLYVLLNFFFRDTDSFLLESGIQLSTDCSKKFSVKCDSYKIDI